MNKAPDMKVIYLNNWLSGSWQVQKIHAQEFINAFKHQKGLQVFTYPRNKVINLRSKAVNGNKIITDIGKAIFKKFHQKKVMCMRPVYIPLHIYLNLPGFPQTMEAWQKTISIPLYPSLTEKEIEKIIAVVKEVF